MRMHILRSASRVYPRVICDGYDISGQIPVDQETKFHDAVPGSEFSFELIALNEANRPYRRTPKGPIQRYTVRGVVDVVEFCE